MFDAKLAHDLALRVAPELAAAPLYFVRHPAGVARPTDCLGYATRCVSPLMQQALTEQGAWRGQGNLVAVCEDLAAPEFQGLVLHEVAHLLPFEAPIPECELDDYLLDADEKIHAYWAADRSLLDPPDAHGRDFVRIAAHLWHRAYLAGVTTLTNWAGGFRYEQSTFDRYLCALSSECRALRHREFKDILATAPPEPFVKLWSADESDREQRRREQDRLADLHRKRFDQC